MNHQDTTGKRSVCVCARVYCVVLLYVVRDMVCVCVCVCQRVVVPDPRSSVGGMLFVLLF